MDENIAKILGLTQDLIRCRSTHDRPNEIHKSIERIRKELDGSGLNVSISEHHGSPSLLASRSEAPEILFCAHIDVVEGQDSQFEPRLEGDRLYGRGALDMKSGLAVLTILASELGQKHDIGLLVTSDEETGGFNGTKYMLDDGLRCRVAILPDGGKAVHRIVNKAKGVLWLELKATGKGAHGSVPWLGDNAISKLLKSIDQVQNLFVAHELHDESHWTATCNIGQIQGGTSTNQVPDSAIARCDIRYTEKETPEAIMDKVRSCLPDGIVAEQLISAGMTYTPMDEPCVIRFQQALREIGREAEQAVDYGSSDARFFSELKIPVIICQPDGEGHHSENEWVSLKGIEDYYLAVKNFVTKSPS